MPINVPYLLILVAVSFAVLLVLRLAQNRLMHSLSAALFERRDKQGFEALLEGAGAKFLLRTQTKGLLRLEAGIYFGDPDAVWKAAAALDAMKLKKPEQLNYLQKALAFAVVRGDEAHARELLQKLEALLAGEKSAHLLGVLADAYILVGVYVDHNPALIPELQGHEQEQSGNQLGITQYRIAKLYHYNGDDDAARGYLKKALQNLEELAWKDVAERALQDVSVLEKH